jgi:L-iditol 2-dehydrogenase
MLGLFKTAKGPGNMELREVPVPEPKPDEVLLEIKAAGICGTDVHIKHDLFPYWPPVIMGHEFSGEIVEVGTSVENFKLGDRVVGEPHTKACGKCELCRTGNIQICAQKRSPGWGIDGAFAPYLVMPEHLLHKIPASLSFEEAALVEPAANVVQDVLERGVVVANDTVVVIGPGPIGLVALMAAKAAGAGKLIIVGIKKDEAIRLPIALEIGVDAVILADEQDAVAEVLKLTDGRGADLVVEASGDASAIASSVGMVRRLGRIAQIGLTGKDQIHFPWDAASWKVCTIIFNLSTAFTCWDRTIGLMADGKIDAKKIITHVLPLEQWERAFELVETMQGIKVLLIPE